MSRPTTPVGGWDAPFGVSIIVRGGNQNARMGEFVQELAGAAPDRPVEMIFLAELTSDVRAAASQSAARFNRDTRYLADDPWAGAASGWQRAITEARGGWICIIDAETQRPRDLVHDLLRRAQTTHADVIVANEQRGPTIGEATTGDTDHASTAGASSSALTEVPRLHGKRFDALDTAFLARRQFVAACEPKTSPAETLLELFALRGPEEPTVPAWTEGVAAMHAEETLSDSLSVEPDHPPRRARVRVRAFEAGRIRDHLRASALFATFSSIGIDLLSFGLLLAVGLHYLLAAVLATQVAIVWHFCLTDRPTYANAQSPRKGRHRFLAFLATREPMLLVRIPMLFALVGGLAINSIPANLLTLVTFAIARALIDDDRIWNPPEQRTPQFRVGS
jgi:dolichol-phosphate mannosyltransferase